MNHRLLKFLFAFFILLGVSFFATSCSPDETTDTATTPSEEEPPAAQACIESGDILVSNSGSDALLVFNPDGTYKTLAFSVSSATESLFGLAWSDTTSEILVAVDGVDRVMAISTEDCSSRTVVTDTNLTGNIRGITQLATTEDILVIETNNIERFGANGNRVNSGWPLAAQTGGTGVGALASGGFVHCSNTTDVVRTYNAAGTQVATRASGIAATTDAMDCKELADGSIATVWSGTTDTVAIYTSNLVTLNASYSNTAYLNTPGGISQRANGNLLIVDRVYNHVVEITNTGTYVGTFGAGYLSTPEYILVVP